MANSIYTYLYGLEKYGILLGLDNIRMLLSLIGNPERKLPCVHIVGTNGKGSTAAFLNSILTSAGYGVGVYTSPHLVRFSERIQVNNKQIPEREISRLASMLRSRIASSPYKDRPFTFFEVTTALALQYFKEREVDIALIEAGLGGRLDATNVLSPLVTVITNIGMEHSEFLGNSLAKIAFEKGSVIKTGVPCVTGENKKKPLSVVADIAGKCNAPLYRLGSDFSIRKSGLTEFSYRGIRNSCTGLELKGLTGINQFSNAALAIATAELLGERDFRITEEHLLQGLRDAVWEGRFQLIRKDPPFIIDGAHNPHGIDSLVRNLKAFFPGTLFTFVVNVLKDKEITGMVKKIEPLARKIIFAPNVNDRSCTPEDFRSTFGSGSFYSYAKDIPSALASVLKKKTPVVFTGSLYGIGEAKEFLDRCDIKS